MISVEILKASLLCNKKNTINDMILEKKVQDKGNEWFNLISLKLLHVEES